jgi:RNA polymerase sigma factor (sigma-70 family)
MEKFSDKANPQLAGIINKLINALPRNLRRDEDVVADLISRLYLSYEKYDPEKASLNTFISLCFRNHISKIIAKRRRFYKKHLVSQEAINIAANTQAEIPFDSNKLHEMLEILSERDRSIVIDRALGNCSFKELGIKFGMAPSKAKSLYTRSIRKVRIHAGNI